MTRFLKSFLVAYALLAPQFSGAQTFCKKYGGAHIEYGGKIYTTSDNGLILTGRTFSLSDTNNLFADSYIIKTDSAGNVLWNTVLRNDAEDIGYDAAETDDNGFVVASSVFSGSGIGNYDVMMTKLDGLGNLQWSKLIGTNQPDESRRIIRTANNHYIITGYCDSVFSSIISFVPFIMRTDDNGNVLWSKRIGLSNGIFAGIANDVTELNDGSLMVAGYISRIDTSVSQTDENIFVARLSSNGNMQWMKRVGNSCTSCHDQGSAILLLNDTTVLVAASTTNMFNGVQLTLLHINGTVYWQKVISTYSFNYSYVSLVKCYDGGYAVGCSSMGNSMDFTVIKFNASHMQLWTHTSGDMLDDVLTGLVEKPNHHLVAFGHAMQSSFYDDLMATEITENGFSCCGNNITSHSISVIPGIDSLGGLTNNIPMLSINAGTDTSGCVETIMCSEYNSVKETYQPDWTAYPNPANTIISVAGLNHWILPLFKITDISGKTVLSGMLPQHGRIDIHTLTAGTYVLHLQHQEKTIAKKIMVSIR